MGLHQLLRPLRARAADLSPAHRAALDAAFGLADGPAPEHFRIAMAVLDLLSEAAADGPLLLIAEDAHWLDRPTSDVLAFVARRLESDPIVLLAATRNGYPGVLADGGLPDTGSALWTRPRRPSCWAHRRISSPRLSSSPPLSVIGSCRRRRATRSP